MLFMSGDIPKSTDPPYPRQDRRYRDLTEDQIPLTESLLDCEKPAEPVWACTIRHDLQAELDVLVVAHRDTLRGVIQQIDNIDDEMIQEISVPPGVPFVYRFDRTLRPIQPKDDHLVQIHTNGFFLEDPGAMKDESCFGSTLRIIVSRTGSSFAFCCS
jgi:bisphosphoglycerate-dependent phosphoglycerate mutase family 1